jgi:hypothetical protein
LSWWDEKEKHMGLSINYVCSGRVGAENFALGKYGLYSLVQKTDIKMITPSSLIKIRYSLCNPLPFPCW